MKANKLKFHLNKMEVLLVGSSLILKCGYMPMLAGVALNLRKSVCSLGVLLDLGLLLEV